MSSAQRLGGSRGMPPPGNFRVLDVLGWILVHFGTLVVHLGRVTTFQPLGCKCSGADPRGHKASEYARSNVWAARSG